MDIYRAQDSKVQKPMARQYDAMVKPRHFNIGDLVLKKVSWQPRTQLMGNWALIGKDPTESSTIKGKDLTTLRPWTGENWSILGMWST